MESRQPHTDSGRCPGNAPRAEKEAIDTVREEQFIMQEVGNRSAVRDDTGGAVVRF